MQLFLTIALSLAPAPAQISPAPDSIVCAAGRKTTLALQELDALLLLRHAHSPRGIEIRRHLLQGRLVEAIGKEQGISVSEAEVSARIATLEEQLRTSGQASTLAEYLDKTGVDPAVFTDYMRLAVLQEKLTRSAVGIAADASVTGEQQTAWLEGEIARRGVTDRPAPWSDGLVLTCPPVRIMVPELLNHLRDQLPETELREACYHLLLAKRIRRRMPDLSPKELERAVDTEVARRRAAAESDPAYAGVPFERLLASQGLSIDSLAQDPSVAIAALSGLYVDRAYGEDGLRAAYNTERAYFDGHYGEALGVRALFLRAARFTNEFVPRTFEAAEAEMREMLAVIQSEEEFRAIAKGRSEAQGELAEGALHWMPKLDKQIGSALLKEAFARWGGHSELPEDPAERVVGPKRTPRGCALLWLSSRRPAPAWETMSRHVRQDLRRRFLADVLEPSDVSMNLAGIPGR
jgi:hypothetical protein